jgi:hypothetical protein
MRDRSRRELQAAQRELNPLDALVEGSKVALWTLVFEAKGNGLVDVNRRAGRSRGVGGTGRCWPTQGELIGPCGKATVTMLAHEKPLRQSRRGILSNKNKGPTLD